MTEEQLKAFLYSKNKDAKPEQVAHLLTQFSVQTVIKFYSQLNIVLHTEKAEEIASQQRNKFVEIVENIDKGNTPWSLYNTLL